jgi:hypothetical protein
MANKHRKVWKVVSGKQTQPKFRVFFKNDAMQNRVWLFIRVVFIENFQILKTILNT